MRNATEIILQSIVIDPTKKKEIQRLLKSFDSISDRAAAIKGYCGRTLGSRLTVEKNMISNLMATASWEELTTRLEDLLNNPEAKPQSRTVAKNVIISENYFN